MKGKNIIRALVLTGIVAWPSVEVYRLQVALGQAEAAQKLAQSVHQKLAQARQVELAAQGKPSAKP